MLLVLLGKHFQQCGMAFTHVNIQTHAVDLAERHALQALVEHTNAVLLALDRLANNIRHAAGADGELLFA